MKRKILLSAGLPILLGGIVAAIVLGIYPALGGSSGTTPSEIAYKYLEHLKRREWEKAYSLTSLSFQEKIPLLALSKGIEWSKFVDNLVSFTIEEVTTEEDRAIARARIEYRNARDEEPVIAPFPIVLVKEPEGWRVDPGWENFLSIKREVLPPLASFQYGGVTISIKSILLYQETNYNPAYTYIRVDIKNSGSYTLRWDVPAPGSLKGYLQDAATGKKYFLLVGGGGMGKVGKIEEYGGGTTERFIIINPQSEGSVFLNVEFVPETVKAFNMLLSGFSFLETGESWDVSFEKVPFRFDVAPLPTPRPMPTPPKELFPDFR